MTCPDSGTVTFTVFTCWKPQSLCWAPGACSLIQSSAVVTRAYTSGNFSQSPQLDTPRIENLDKEDVYTDECSAFHLVFSLTNIGPPESPLQAPLVPLSQVQMFSSVTLNPFSHLSQASWHSALLMMVTLATLSLFGGLP